jgi:hypothetical protein
MEVGWEPSSNSLFSPRPREWSYARWFQQIIGAAREHGYRLVPNSNTDWADIQATTRQQFLQAASGEA